LSTEGASNVLAQEDEISHGHKTATHELQRTDANNNDETEKPMNAIDPNLHIGATLPATERTAEYARRVVQYKQSLEAEHPTIPICADWSQVPDGLATCAATNKDRKQTCSMCGVVTHFVSRKSRTKHDLAKILTLRSRAMKTNGELEKQIVGAKVCKGSEAYRQLLHRAGQGEPVQRLVDDFSLSKAAQKGLIHAAQKYRKQLEGLSCEELERVGNETAIALRDKKYYDEEIAIPQTVGSLQRLRRNAADWQISLINRRIEAILRDEEIALSYRKTIASLEKLRRDAADWQTPLIDHRLREVFCDTKLLRLRTTASLQRFRCTAADWQIPLIDTRIEEIAACKRRRERSRGTKEHIRNGLWKSRPAWRKENRKVKANAEPRGYGTRLYGVYPVYALEETEPVRQAPPPVAGDPNDPAALLAAIFSVNRSAKRFRDAASSCYAKEVHGLAKANRQRKERLYSLKDVGVAAAFRAGYLRAVGMQGGLCIYREMGYCFHSTLRPRDACFPEGQIENGRLFVEAKPRTATDTKLRDAIALLASLPQELDGFKRHKFRSPRRRSMSNRCSRVAHFAQSDNTWDDEYDCLLDECDSARDL